MHKIVQKPSADDETWFFIQFVSDDEEEEEEEEEAQQRNCSRIAFSLYLEIFKNVSLSQPTPIKT